MTRKIKSSLEIGPQHSCRLVLVLLGYVDGETLLSLLVEGVEGVVVLGFGRAGEGQNLLFHHINLDRRSCSIAVCEYATTHVPPVRDNLEETSCNVAAP